MPHCIIEHSISLNGADLVPIVFDAALASGLFAENGQDIKVRALAYQHYLTGKEKSDFVHITLRILSGRTDEQKQSLSQVVLQRLSGVSLEKCSVTVEIVEMDRNSYGKSVSV